MGSLLFYETFLVLGILIMCGASFLIYAFEEARMDGSCCKRPGIKRRIHFTISNGGRVDMEIEKKRMAHH